jgi:glycosyltransferase involved in cell wall biosynthesis
MHIHRVYVPIKRLSLEPFMNGLLFMTGSIFKTLQLGDFDVYAPQHFFPVPSSWLSSKLLSTPIVVTIHDVFFNREWIQQYGFKGSLMSIFENITLNMPYDGVITVSNSSKEKMVAGGVPENVIDVIPNGVDLGFFDGVKAEKSKRLRVIYVGRLIEYKHVDELMAAFSKLKVDAELYIVGVGPERKNLEELAVKLGIVDRTTFTGFISDREKVELLKSSHVAVLASTVEGFGIAPVEAMAAGIPTLSSDIPALREVADGGRAGILFRPRDVEDLRAKLEQLLKDEALREEFAKKGYRLAKEKYSWDEVAKAVEGSLKSRLRK